MHKALHLENSVSPWSRMKGKLFQFLIKSIRFNKVKNDEELEATPQKRLMMGKKEEKVQNEEKRRKESKYTKEKNESKIGIYQGLTIEMRVKDGGRSRDQRLKQWEYRVLRRRSKSRTKEERKEGKTRNKKKKYSKYNKS